MNKSDLPKNLPDKSGVYLFKKGREILYIGKATSLRDRTKSYFNGDIHKTRGPVIEKMIDLATRLDFIETDSVLEAIILETNLIKKHKPKFNTKEKDDKSFNFITISREDYPRVLIERGKNIKGKEKEYKYLLGPFPRGTELKEAVKILRKIFPFRDKCKPDQGKPCFNNQIGLCPGVCTGLVSKTEYNKIIRNLILFLKGEKNALVKNLEREMKKLAKKRDFEKASEIRNKIFGLNHIKDVALLKREKVVRVENNFVIEAYDVAHTSGKNTVGVMTVVHDGEIDKSAYKKFKIRGAGVDKNNDILNLKEILTRRFEHAEWDYPNMIVVDGGRAQINAAEKLLDIWGVRIPVVSVTKDERHRPKSFLGDKILISKHKADILLANAEAHRFAINYHRKLRDRLV